MISPLACSWLPLPPSFVSILACFWLLLLPCLPSFVSLRDLHSGLLLAAPALIPQIAGSYRGSYFSMTDRQNPEMVVVPLPPCLPLSPFMISILGCSWLLLPPCLPSFCRCRLVSLRDLHSVLLFAAAALSPKIVSLHAS